eukprot:COSAG03_NODE_1943_length_3322_cov_2.875582_1_plen_448_part_00
MWRWRPAEIFPHQGLGVMLPDKSRREAERKRAEALLAQITGGAAAQSHGARRVTERSSVIGDRAIGALRDRAPIAQRSDGAGGTGADAHADSASATPSVLSPQRIRFNRYDRDGDGVLDRAEVRAFLRDQVGVDTRILSRPGFMADVMRLYGHSGTVRLQDFEELVAFATSLSHRPVSASGVSPGVVSAGDAEAEGAASASTAGAVDSAPSATTIFQEKRAARIAHEAVERVTSLEVPAHRHAYSRLQSDWSRSGGQAMSSTARLQQMKDASERAKRRAQMQHDFAQACVRNSKPPTGKHGTGGSPIAVGAAPSRPAERGHGSYKVDAADSTRTPFRPPTSVRTPASSSLDQASSSLAWTGDYGVSAPSEMASTAMGVVDDSGWELQLSPKGTSFSLPGTPALTHPRNSVLQSHHREAAVLHPKRQLGAVPRQAPSVQTAFAGWTSS